MQLGLGGILQGSTSQTTGWQEIDGKWYYFEPRAEHLLEYAQYISDQNGVQYIGEF